MGEYRAAHKALHNFISEFESITTLRPILLKAAEVEEFLETAEAKAEVQKAALDALEAQVAEAQSHLDSIPPKAAQTRVVAEQALEDDLRKRESDAMKPIASRVNMAENSARVLEQRVVGLESKIVQLTTTVSERQAVLDEKNADIAEIDALYKSLLERKVS